MTTGQPVVRVLVELPMPIDVSLLDGGVPKASSAANPRSLSVSIVIACVGVRPRTGRWPVGADVRRSHRRDPAGSVAVMVNLDTHPIDV